MCVCVCVCVCVCECELFLTSSMGVTLLEESFIDDVEDTRVIKASAAPIALQAWFNLDGADASIGFNILPKFFASEKHMREEIVILAPLFRMVTSGFINKGDGLGAVDAMLGCPLILCNQNAAREEFSNFPLSDQLIICSAMLVAMNIIREVINAFAHPQASVGADDDFSKKVCLRFHNLLDLEAVFTRCVATMPRFVPLGTVERPGAVSVKNPGLGSLPATKKKGKGSDAEDPLALADFACYLRPFDSCLYSLLMHPIADADPADAAPNSELQLQVDALVYLHRDLNTRLKRWFSKAKVAYFRATGATTGGHDSVASMLQLEEIKGIIPFIHHHVRTAVTELGEAAPEDEEIAIDMQEQPEEEEDEDNEPVDHDDDGDSGEKKKKKRKAKDKKKKKAKLPSKSVVIHSSTRRDFLMEFLTIWLDSLRTILEAQELKSSSEGQMLMADVLMAFATGAMTVKEERTDDYITEACVAAFTELDHVQTVFARIDDTVCVLRVMDLLLFTGKRCTTEPEASRAPLQSMATKLSHAAHSALGTAWGHNSRLKSENVGVLVRLEIEHADNSLALIRQLVMKVLPSVCKEDDSASQSQFDYHATLSKVTFAHYFKPIFEQLCVVMNNVTQQHSGPVEDDDERTDDGVELFNTCAVVFHELLMLCKHVEEDKSVLATAVAQGRLFIDAVIKEVAFFESRFKRYKTKFMEATGHIQKGTRILQIICATSKRQQDTTITKNVPFVKKSMEQFIYSVKILLKANNVLSSMTQGNLKAKALDGGAVSDEDHDEDVGSDAALDRLSGASESEDDMRDEQSVVPARLNAASKQRKAAKGTGRRKKGPTDEDEEDGEDGDDDDDERDDGEDEPEVERDMDTDQEAASVSRRPVKAKAKTKVKATAGAAGFGRSSRSQSAARASAEQDDSEAIDEDDDEEQAGEFALLDDDDDDDQDKGEQEEEEDDAELDSAVEEEQEEQEVRVKDKKRKKHRSGHDERERSDKKHKADKKKFKSKSKHRDKTASKSTSKKSKGKHNRDASEDEEQVEDTEDDDEVIGDSEEDDQETQDPPIDMDASEGGDEDEDD
jgi:hypothetical protein